MPLKLVQELQAVIINEYEALASCGAVGLQRCQQALHARADGCFQALLRHGCRGLPGKHTAQCHCKAA